MKFKEGKIIKIVYVEKNKKKVPIIIRYPNKSDTKAVWKFYNKVIKETENLSRISPVSLKEEKKWLSDVMVKMKKNITVQLLVESNGKIIGSASLSIKNEERRKHVGDFGIAILQEFTGLGIGKKLMIEIEKDTRKMGMKIMVLSVHGKNKIAQNLYRKMGFNVSGKIPESIKIKKGYDTNITMYKVLKK